MRILLDECLPRDLRAHLSEHECYTVQDMGWSGKKNGTLAALAKDHFDVLLTIDQRFSDHLGREATMAVLILSARTNKIEDLLPLVPAIRQALLSFRSGLETPLIRIP